MTKVKVSIGRTYNLGNYESLRLDVGLEDESDDDVRIAFEHTRNTVKNMLIVLEQEHKVGG